MDKSSEMPGIALNPRDPFLGGEGDQSFSQKSIKQGRVSYGMSLSRHESLVEEGTITTQQKLVLM